MRAIAVVGLALVLAGCASSAPNYSQFPDDARKKALDELLADADQQSRSGLPKSSGSSASDYKIDPDKLEKTYAEIRRRENGTTNAGPTPQASPPNPSSKWGEGWEVYGDWYVKALHDEMDTVTRVRLFTPFDEIEDYPSYGVVNPKDQTFGLEVFGGSFVTLSPSMYLGGKMYWPFCESDFSSVSVDGSKAVRMTPVENPGSCNSLEKNGVVIRKFITGSQAKVRMHYDDGMISLKGFGAAWDRAMQLGAQ
ncbi:MAG: hypothetical protein CMK74_19635 [Pseudomonadales bacterium]|jgi:hypothetical protein|nr:hypothetical protein [Pseudomonadales bacterium]HAG77582.1 hypothetical protein [Pseudomonas sp.]|tara:strand:+ start:1622 stop:2377 length:756 start_codon:yes stop_codon:yes gene_type:complete